MRKCCICFHENRKSPKPGLSTRSMFLLPKNEDVRNEWLKVVPERSKYMKNLMVCENHFAPSDFQLYLKGCTNVKKRLMPTAVPHVSFSSETKAGATGKIYQKKSTNRKSHNEAVTGECVAFSSEATDHNYHNTLGDEMQLDTSKLVAAKTTHIITTKENSEPKIQSKKFGSCSTEKQLLQDEEVPTFSAIEETLVAVSKPSTSMEREAVMKLNITSKLPVGWFEAVPTSFIRTFIEHVNVPGENTRLAVRSFKINAELTTITMYVLDNVYRSPARFTNEKDLVDVIARFASLPLCSGVPNSEEYEDVPLSAVARSWSGQVWRSKMCCHIAMKSLPMCRPCQKLKASLNGKILGDPKRKTTSCSNAEKASDDIASNQVP